MGVRSVCLGPLGNYIGICVRSVCLGPLRNYIGMCVRSVDVVGLGYCTAVFLCQFGF